MTRYLIFAAAVIALLGGVALFSYRAGEAHVKAQIDAAKVDALNSAADAAIRLAAAEQEKARLARELEDAANQEPVSVPVALPPSRLRRINAAIAAANGTVPKP